MAKEGRKGVCRVSARERKRRLLYQQLTGTCLKAAFQRAMLSAEGQPCRPETVVAHLIVSYLMALRHYLES